MVLTLGRLNALIVGFICFRDECCRVLKRTFQSRICSNASGNRIDNRSKLTHWPCLNEAIVLRAVVLELVRDTLVGLGEGKPNATFEHLVPVLFGDTSPEPPKVTLLVMTSEPPLPSLEERTSPAILENEKLLDRELLISSREFACEQRGRSWRNLITTLIAVFVSLAVAAMADAIWMRAFASLLIGLMAVRMFIIYHDYQHGAIFKDSWLGGAILSAYGFIMLTPPTVWKRSHDHHHRNNSKLFGASIGSFPIMTTVKYQASTSSEQLEYRMARSPLVILFGYLTVFMFGMCLRPFMIDRKRHWDAPISFLIHFGLIAACTWFAGWQTAAFMLVIPALIATTSGAYLFYAQHNFPSAKIRPRDQWTYTGAALQSSSFLEMGPIMNWLTGNIGYHHVHHLNSKIPFYRLPEAMAALVPLQSPNTTTLGVWDIVGCLKLKLWDAERNRFVTFAEAKK